MSKLIHSNIIPIHHFGEENGISYFVMDYVGGGSLNDTLMQRGVLSLAESIKFVLQAAKGLDAAHGHGIIHRDVKPSHMLLRPDGQLLLTGFGIAKVLEGTTNLTRTGIAIGTPQYMSPEQGTGLPVDRRSDIYSLGIVLFRCLAGRLPFSGDSPLTITARHLQDPLPVDWLRAENVPAAVIRLILKMTAKRQQDRYQSMTGVIDALVPQGHF